MFGFEVKRVSLLGFHFGFVVNSLYKIYWGIILSIELRMKNLIYNGNRKGSFFIRVLLWVGVNG